MKLIRKNMFKKYLLLAAFLLQPLISAYAACASNVTITRPDSRYEVVAGATPAGSEIRDKVTKLIWQRCMVGKSWDGTTCTGTALQKTWAQALEIARTATATTATPQTPWRVPNRTEVLSLIERACIPSINETWFPAQGNPSNVANDFIFWTSSSLSDGNSAYDDDVRGGWVSSSGKSGNNLIKLVRSGS
jgi:hypothetical protein